MPRGRPTKRAAPAVRPPSARRAAMLHPVEPDLPAPPVRRRRIASAAAGRPEDLPPTDTASAASLVVLVTREVLQQLREDRDAALPSLPAPVRPAPVLPVAEPLDMAVTGALSTMVDTDIYTGEPPPIPSIIPMHTTPLGAELSAKLKNKIWADEFVDFIDLTHPVQQRPQQVSVQSGETHQVISIMPQSRGRQISSIDQWTSALLVFGAVYTQRFPQSAPGIFKYAEIVRDIALTGPPFAWRQYDAHFRTLRQTDPSSFPWAQPRWDLFFKYMYAKHIQGGSGRAPFAFPNQAARRPQPFQTGFCWLYQKGGKCSTRNCRYKHLCSKCQAPHPASSCRLPVANPSKR